MTESMNGGIRQGRTQVSAAAFMLFSILAYSVFPLIGTRIVGHVHPVLFIGCCHLFALLALSVATGFLRLQNKVPPLRGIVTRAASRSFLWIALGSGLANAASHATLFGSFHFISSPSGTALYEIWPVAVVIVIERMLPRHYSRMRLREWLFAAVSIAGVALLIRSEMTTPSTSTTMVASVPVGVSLALLSACLMAASSGLDVVLARRLDGEVSPYVQPILAQNVVKLFSATGTLAAYFLVWRSRGDDLLPNPIFFLTSAATGVLIVAFGAVTFHIGNLLSKSSAVNLLWYLTPALSLVWLDILGVAKISGAVAIGALLIITANLLTTIRADRRSAYTGTLAGICASAFYCNYIDGLPDEHYWEMIGVITGFFAILVSFMLQRVSERTYQISVAAVDVLEGVRTSQRFEPDEKQALTSTLLESLQGGSAGNRADSMITNSNVYRDRDHQVDLLIRKLYLTCASVVTFGELFALFMLAGLGLLITHLGRPNSLAGDLIPVVLTAVVTFLCLRIRDEERGHASTPVVAMYRGVGSSGTDEAIPTDYSRANLLSGIILCGVFSIYILALVRKYNVELTLH